MALHHLCHVLFLFGFSGHFDLWCERGEQTEEEGEAQSPQGRGGRCEQRAGRVPRHADRIKAVGNGKSPMFR